MVFGGKAGGAQVAESITRRPPDTNTFGRLEWAEEDVTKLRDVKDSHDRLQNKVDAFNKLPWWKRPFINI